MAAESTRHEHEAIGHPLGPVGVEPVLVELDQLQEVWSARIGDLDQDYVELLAGIWDRLPSILVRAQTRAVIDGRYRVEAARRLGKSRISAVLIDVSDRDARVLSVQANVNFGRPLDRDERRNAAAAIHDLYPERSDRWVAATCGLPIATVAALPRADGADSVAVGDLAPQPLTSRRTPPQAAQLDVLHDARRLLAGLDGTATRDEDWTALARSVPPEDAGAVVAECTRRAEAWSRLARAVADYAAREQ